MLTPESGSVLGPLLLLAIIAILVAGAYLLGRRAQRRDDSSLSALARVGRAILDAQLDVDAIGEVVYEQAGLIVDASNFQLGLIEGDDYVIKVWVRDGARLPSQRFAGRAREGIIGWVRQARQSLLVRDFQREWDQLPARPSYDLRKDAARAGVFVPLLAGGEAIGVMAIQSHTPNAFHEEHLRLLTVLASQAAGALQNAQRYQSDQVRIRQLQIIAQVTQQITAVQPLPDLFRQIVSLVHEAFGYYVVSVFIVDEAAGVVRLGASTAPEIASEAPSIEMGQGIIGWVAQHAAMIHAPDVTQEPRFRCLATVAETRAEVALPLLVENRVLGVLDVMDDEVNAFSAEDLNMLTTLAGQLSLAIQEASTYNAARRQSDRLATMVEASRAMVSILDIDDLVEEVVDLVVDYFGFDRVHIFVRSGERLVFRAGSGVHSGLWEIEQLSYALDEPGLIALAARTGEPVVSNNVLADPNYRPGPAVEDTRAEVAVPIRMGRLILGVFDVQSLEANAFTPEDVALVQGIADSLAVALRNASLYANEQRRRVLAETLRQLGTVLTSNLDLESVLEGILLALERVVAFDAGLILLRDETEIAYVVRAALGATEGVLGERVPGGGLAHEEMLWWLHDLTERHAAEDGGEKGESVIVPLEAGGDQIGYLVLERSGSEMLSDDERRIVETFAAQAAVAITNAQLFAAQQEEAWVTAALLQVAEAITSEVDPDAMLETIVRLTSLLAGVDRCGILEWRPDARYFAGRTARGLGAEAEADFCALALQPNQWPFLEHILSTHEPVWTGDGAGPEAPAPLVAVFGSAALLGIPLVTKGELMGLMLVDRAASAAGIDSRRLNILAGIAYLTALAMQSAQLQAEAAERERLERELEVARQIQTSFLPQEPPQIPGWEVATFYRPARRVGGDFYDFIPLGKGLCGFVVADVAGKGVPAALFMALSRTLIRAAALSRTSPSKTLERVNEMVIADVHTDLFVTVYYLVLEPETGLIRHATGGHNPPAYLPQDGPARYVRGQGMAIGVLDSIAIQERTMRLEPGEVIVLYTDGIVEAFNMNMQEFGADRFLATLESCRGASAGEIVSEISKTVLAFAEGEPQFDDMTLVVLKRLEQ